MIEVNKQLLNQIKLSEEVAKKVRTEFNDLNEEQLNYKPAPGKWSAGECFQHLIKSNAPYIDMIMPELIREYEKKIYYYKPTIQGRLILNSVRPEAKRKSKTNKNFFPSGLSVSSRIINEFLDQHKIITDLIKKSMDKDLNKIKIRSPFIKFIRYNLGDAYEIILQHDLRHLNQAKAAVEKSR